MKRTVWAVAVLGLLAAAPVLAQAVVDETRREAIRGVPDRWGFTLGSFWQTFDTRVRLDASDGETGTEIDFEKDLGLNDRLTDFDFKSFYRFADRHRLDLTYLAWDRTNATVIDRQIQWGDEVFDVNANVETREKAQLLNLIYKYSFFNNGRVDFGLNGGISSLWSDTRLSGETSNDGGHVATESKNVIFPIPVLGLHFEMTLAKRFFWSAEGNFFDASIAGYEGHVNEVTTALDYFVTKNIALGVGFASTTYNVGKEGSEGGDARVRLSFSGVLAHLAFAF